MNEVGSQAPEVRLYTSCFWDEQFGGLHFGGLASIWSSYSPQLSFPETEAGYIQVPRLVTVPSPPA